MGSRSHIGAVRCYREGKDHWSLFPSKMQTDVFDFVLSWKFPQMHQLTCAYYKVNKFCSITFSFVPGHEAGIGGTHCYT